MRATSPGLVLSFNLLLMVSCMPAAMDGEGPDPARPDRGSGGKTGAAAGSGGTRGSSGGASGEASGGSSGAGSGGDRAGGSGNTGGTGVSSGGRSGQSSGGGAGGSAPAGSGGGGGTNPNGRPDGAPGDVGTTMSPDAASAGPTFAKVWTDLLMPTCGTPACHGRKGPPDGIDMQTQMAAYTTLMAKAITKGDPVKSKIVMLIEAKKMPPGGKPTVSAPQISDLKAWITAGARND
jgi:hypothetical protein